MRVSFSDINKSNKEIFMNLKITSDFSDLPWSTKRCVNGCSAAHVRCISNYLNLEYLSGMGRLSCHSLNIKYTTQKFCYTLPERRKLELVPLGSSYDDLDPNYSCTKWPTRSVSNSLATVIQTMCSLCTYWSLPMLDDGWVKGLHAIYLEGAAATIFAGG